MSWKAMSQLQRLGRSTIGRALGDLEAQAEKLGGWMRAEAEQKAVMPRPRLVAGRVLPGEALLTKVLDRLEVRAESSVPQEPQRVESWPREPTMPRRPRLFARPNGTDGASSAEDSRSDPWREASPHGSKTGRGAAFATAASFLPRPTPAVAAEVARSISPGLPSDSAAPSPRILHARSPGAGTTPHPATPQPTTPHPTIPAALGLEIADHPAPLPEKSAQALSKLASRVRGGSEAANRPVAAGPAGALNDSAKVPAKSRKSAAPKNAASPSTVSQNTALPNTASLLAALSSDGISSSAGGRQPRAPGVSPAELRPGPTIVPQAPDPGKPKSAYSGGLHDLLGWWQQEESQKRPQSPSEIVAAAADSDGSPALESEGPAIPSPLDPQRPIRDFAGQGKAAQDALTEISQPTPRRIDPQTFGEAMEQSLDEILRREAHRHGLEIEE